MASYDQVFQPGPTVTQNLAVTAGSASIMLNNLSASTGRSIRVVNSGSNAVYLAFDTAATTTQGMIMLPNTVESFTLPQGTLAVYAISTSTGNTVFITTGNGM